MHAIYYTTDMLFTRTIQFVTMAYVYFQNHEIIDGDSICLCKRLELHGIKTVSSTTVKCFHRDVRPAMNHS